ncbi:hypothetical protein RUM43_001178 [Polyplax serrata]|uniref:Lipase domain-containing protein n=1 Tax=Polyplax serrata TaxID=468196 RepID=A0AAN8SHA3_POLSC
MAMSEQDLLEGMKLTASHRGNLVIATKRIFNNRTGFGFSDGFWWVTWGPPNRGFKVREEDVKFNLFVRQTRENGSRLFIGDKVTLALSGFDPSLPTKICTHGYLDSGKTWVLQMKNEYLQSQDVNFIAVDWSQCAKNIFYDQVVLCMREAAYFLGQLLEFLQRDGGLNVETTHMIGHSLGAHLVALAAKGVSYGSSIGRITGEPREALDPAAPLIENAPESERLNPRSAKFVDVIHSSAFFVGIRRPVGTVDFYPNGGYFQPGCRPHDIRCHHKACVWYFLDTIKGTDRFRYPGRKCKTLRNALNGTCDGQMAYMGDLAEKSAPGLYHVQLIEIENSTNFLENPESDTQWIA